ncbi:MAG TPA: hypothetical protein VGD60_05295 [Candidatus Acidoferrales bacterium]
MSSTQRRPRTADIFKQEDPSIHMLGLPKSRPRLRQWVLIAILFGAVVALLLTTLLAP